MQPRRNDLAIHVACKFRSPLRRALRPTLSFLFSLSAIGTLAGCAHGIAPHLYSEERDKEGQALAKAWDDTHLSDYFDAMRTERAKLLAAEMASVTERKIAERDSTARSIVAYPLKDPPPSSNSAKPPPEALHEATPADVAKAPSIGSKAHGLYSMLEEKKNALVGAESPKEADKLLNQINGEVANINELQVGNANNYAAIFVLTGVEVECTKTTDPDVSAKMTGRALVSFNSFKEKCDKIHNAKNLANKALNKLDGGVRGVANRLLSAHDNLEKNKSKVKAASAEYAALATMYKSDSQAAMGSTDASIHDKVEADAKKLDKAVKDLTVIRNSLSDQALASKRVDALDAILKGAESGTPPRDASDLEIAAILLPGIADDIRALRTSSSAKPYAAIALRLKLEQMLVKRAQSRVDMDEKKVALLQEILDLTVSEAATVCRALNSFPGTIDKSLRLVDIVDLEQPEQTDWQPRRAMADGSSAPTRPRTSRLTGKPTPAEDERRALIASAFDLLEIYTNQEAAIERKRYQSNALDYEDSVLEAQGNAEQYGALIDVVVKQSASYAASGIKGEVLSKIVNALSLIWIGHGVNK